MIPLITDFYPRPLRGGRPFTAPTTTTTARFLSTPSARRATCHADDCRLVDAISIHALCEEGDAPSAFSRSSHSHFYPRPLRGGRRGGVLKEAAQKLFLSTPSARRATLRFVCRCCCFGYFYPRPLRGGRQMYPGTSCQPKLFLSTPSARRATNLYGLALVAGSFLSTPSARRATSSGTILPPTWKHFYPRPLRGGRPITAVRVYDRNGISIHALCEEGDRSWTLQTAR